MEKLTSSTTALDNKAAKKNPKGRRKMERVKFEVTLPATIKKKANYWVSSCPALDVFSQGATEEEAKKNLEEALKLFLISCYERGTLDAALKECGFDIVNQTEKQPRHKSSTHFVHVPIYLLARGRCTSQCRA
jgi:predicted RNase H-like HicB family nuclease